CSTRRAPAGPPGRAAGAADANKTAAATAPAQLSTRSAHHRPFESLKRTSSPGAQLHAKARAIEQLRPLGLARTSQPGSSENLSDFLGRPVALRTPRRNVQAQHAHDR